MTERQAPDLDGRAILVVEDEWFIATELSDELRRTGASVLGPLPGLPEALAAIREGAPMDGAVLDVNLGREMVWPAVDELLSRGVPVVLTTGYEAAAIPSAYAHLPRAEKPASAREVARLIARQIGAGAT